MTKKVKNKDVDQVDDADQVMHDPEISKIFFKEMLMGNRSTRIEEDVLLSLNDEEEIILLEDDVKISLNGLYPQVCFSERAQSLIDESNRQMMIIRGRPIGYKACPTLLKVSRD